MVYATDQRVDAYIGSVPGWQQAICRKVRELVHAADSGVTETIKRTDRPYRWSSKASLILFGRKAGQSRPIGA
jgi:hypothetical protein